MRDKTAESAGMYSVTSYVLDGMEYGIGHGMKNADYQITILTALQDIQFMASLGSAERMLVVVWQYTPPVYMQTKEYISTRSTCNMHEFQGIFFYTISPVYIHAIKNPGPLHLPVPPQCTLPTRSRLCHQSLP